MSKHSQFIVFAFVFSLLIEANTAFSDPKALPTPPPPPPVPGKVFESEKFSEVIKASMPAVVLVTAVAQNGKDSATSSGFLYDSENGRIATTAHGLKDATKVFVKFKNGREIEATNFYSDTKTDLALLTVDPNKVKGLKALELGSSSVVAIDEEVRVISSPATLDFVATNGRIGSFGVSHTNADLLYESYFHFTAPIATGSSGGPVINSQGKVIGITAAQVNKPQSGWDGMSLAIPSDLASLILTRLAEDGRVVRTYLGARVDTIDIQTREGLGLEHGLQVREVLGDETPAALAGFKAGDIILNYLILGQEVKPANKLFEFRMDLAHQKLGTDVDFQVIRRENVRKPLTLSARLDIQPENPNRTHQPLSLKPERIESLKLEAESVSKAKAKALGHAESKIPSYGLLVTAVDTPTLISRKGIEKGTIILQMAGFTVRSITDANTILNQVDKTRPISILILQRNGRQQLVSVDVE